MRLEDFEFDDDLDGETYSSRPSKNRQSMRPVEQFYDASFRQRYNQKPKNSKVPGMFRRNNHKYKHPLEEK